MSKKRMFSVILALSIVICGCSKSDVTDQVANVVQAEDPHILSVKGGTPYSYPDKEYGTAFDSFFSSPTWKYFVGTKEGSDEDGDGKADYTEEDVDIVEFTGYCTYQDVKVKALIQFTLNKEEDTFEATYLSFNEVPQNMFMLSALLEAVFTDEDIIETAGNNSGTEDQLQEALLDGTIVSKDSPCFPIMFKGYEGAECPVMVQDEQNGELVSGTYDEMLESCVNDGVTMFAPPTYYDGFIYTATKWDAYPDQWYDGLLTYDEFIFEINRLAGIGGETESSDSYSNMFVDQEEIPYEEIAGSYTGISTNGCSISMYSSMEDETVGNIQFEYNGADLSGELINLQTNVYQVLTSDGTEVIFGVYTDNGKIGLDLYVNGTQTDYLMLYEHYYS